MARRRSARRPLAAGVLVLISLSAACGSDSDNSGPLDGETLYGQNCASCHGSDPRGTARGPSHLSVVYAPSHHPDASFLAAIRQGARQHHWGFGDMPPVEGVEDNEARAIIDYIREQQESEGFEPYPPAQPEPGRS